MRCTTGRQDVGLRCTSTVPLRCSGILLVIHAVLPIRSRPLTQLLNIENDRPRDAANCQIAAGSVMARAALLGVASSIPLYVYGAGPLDTIYVNRQMIRARKLAHSRNIEYGQTRHPQVIRPWKPVRRTADLVTKTSSRRPPH